MANIWFISFLIVFLLLLFLILKCHQRNVISNIPLFTRVESPLQFFFFLTIIIQYSYIVEFLQENLYKELLAVLKESQSRLMLCFVQVRTPSPESAHKLLQVLRCLTRKHKFLFICLYLSFLITRGFFLKSLDI